MIGPFCGFGSVAKHTAVVTLGGDQNAPGDPFYNTRKGNVAVVGAEAGHTRHLGDAYNTRDRIYKVLELLEF